MAAKYGKMSAKAMIADAEGRHARRLAEIADAIVEANEGGALRTVLVSGPSSSGKTTFAGRLGAALAARGLQPVPISIDDYFIDRDKTPLDEYGQPDFEAVEAVDLALMNEQLQRLTSGEEVVLPIYDFITGTRRWQEKPLRLADNSVMIIEGLHALNPRLTNLVPDNAKYKIFISCLTAAESSDGERISTFDVRLIRRISRDSAKRGRTAASTIDQWPSVRRGEDKYVFPFLSEADTTFDSSLRYELSALRPLAEPLLAEVKADEPEKAESERLLGILSHFKPVGADEVPSESLLCEFIGR